MVIWPMMLLLLSSSKYVLVLVQQTDMYFIILRHSLIKFIICCMHAKLLFCLHAHDSIWPNCMHAKECKLHVNICLHVCVHNLLSFCLQSACILLAYINLHAGYMHCFRTAHSLLTFAFTNTNINAYMHVYN